jgi:hypothetical protein
VWRTRFGKGYGPVLRQTAGRTNKQAVVKLLKRAYRSHSSGKFAQFACVFCALLKEAVKCSDNTALVTDKWVWSICGMLLAGVNRDIQRKIYRSDTLSTLTFM